MEPIFENKTAITKEIVFKAAKLHYEYSYKLLRVWNLILGIFCAFMAIVAIIYSGPVNSVSMAILCVIIFLSYFYGHLLYAGRLYAALMAQNPAGEDTYKFYDEEFEDITPNSQRKDSYSQIKHIIITRDLYLLMLNKDAFFIIDKNGFTKGTNGEFMDFVSEKFKGRMRYKLKDRMERTTQ